MISPQDGGLEAQDFAGMLARMYEKHGERAGIKVRKQAYGEHGWQVVYTATAEELARITQGEEGTHKLTRASPYGNGKVHTSFAVVLLHKSQQAPQVSLLKKDIEWEAFRSTGPGGQHKNKTDSAIRMKHVPTGTVVIAARNRSQHRNREIAMENLQKRVQDGVNEHSHAKKEQAWTQRRENTLLIRSYKLNHGFVVDEVGGLRTGDVQGVLDGKLGKIRHG